MTLLAPTKPDVALMSTLASFYDRSPEWKLSHKERVDFSWYVNSEYNGLINRYSFVRFERSHTDPYESYEAMVFDIVRNNRLVTYTGGTDSVWDKETNIRLRTIHDWAHYISHSNFTFEGKLSTWRWAAGPRVRGVSDAVRSILFSEVVLQAAYTLTIGKFPTQKLVKPEAWMLVL